MTDELTPEAIGQKLFSSPPQPACSCQLISDDHDALTVFEILSIILMEGLDMKTDIPKINSEIFSEVNILNLNPWLNSICFKINVNKFNFFDKEKYNKYYCKIMINDKLTEPFFIMKNLHKNYHFLLNGNYLEENKNKNLLNELTGVILNGDDVYEISFELLYGII